MKKLLLLSAALQLGGMLQAQVDINSNLVICMPISGSASDYSGNSNNGTPMGGASLIPNRNSVSNSAYAFNGSTDYIFIPGASSSLDGIESNSELTISAWCYVNDWYQGWNVFAIFDRYHASNDYGWDYTIQAPVSCNEQAFCSNYPVTGSGCTFSSPGTTTFKTWAHYAITYSKASGLFSAYKNGNLISTTSTGGVTIENTSQGDAYIGFSPSGPDEFSDGAIDEVMVYNRELNAISIKALYRGYNCRNPYDGQPLDDKGKTTGIKENAGGENFASIYPNPGSDRLNFSISSASNQSEHVTVTMYSLDGKTALTQTLPASQTGNYSLDINGLSQGLYMVNISCGSTSQNVKFVKQ